MPEIRPQSGPQWDFLSTEADIAVFGGSAFGGKTYALLLECVRHVDIPDFGAVIFRRTSPQITNEGGLWDSAGGLYPQLGAVPKVGTLDWTFPSGANISFRHLQHETDKYDWQGTQIALLAFDELSHFSENQFFYLISRNRSLCGVRPYVRATTNPDPGWVKRFIAPWVDKDYPDPAKSGELRWFIRHKGQLVWARSPDELKGVNPDFEAKSVTFIRSSIFDNKIGLERDPGYLGNLQALPEVERRRLLEGDWDVRREGLVYPKMDTCYVSAPDPLPEGRDVGGMDFGFNHPFCALAAVLDRDDVLWVHWERYKRQTTLPEHAGCLPPGVSWSADPARPDSIAELRIAGHDVLPCVHLGARPILTGIDLVSERIRTGRLKISRECRELIRECGLYGYDVDKDSENPIDAENHACDALRYLITSIDRTRAIIPKATPVEEDRAALDRAIRRMEARKRHEERVSNPDDPIWFPGLEETPVQRESAQPVAEPDGPWWRRLYEDES